jgi:ribosomal protein S18 acetylase RimI-like enzyme
MIRSMEILKARPEQAVALTELSLRSKALWGYDKKFIEQCREELTITTEEVVASENTILVGSEGGEIVGFVCIKEEDNGKASLEGLFIDPDHVRNGYGKKLFQEAVKIAKERNYKTLEIHSDPNAVSFYEKMGAKNVGEVPSDSIPGRMLPLYELTL